MVEIHAFKCQCGKVFELGDSDEYVTVYGNLLLGENSLLLGGSQPEFFSDVKPARICKWCLAKKIRLV